jgi:hypothetical protein
MLSLKPSNLDGIPKVIVCVQVVMIWLDLALYTNNLKAGETSADEALCRLWLRDWFSSRYVKCLKGYWKRNPCQKYCGINLDAVFRMRPFVSHSRPFFYASKASPHSL